MTKILTLMRHAKSSWDNPALSDFERPLNARGKRSAKILGDWLRETHNVPDEVYCSTALRTQETLEGLAIQAEVVVSDSLYHADAKRLKRVLGTSHSRHLLVVGHNPGIQEFAASLVTDPPRHPRFVDYPTGATLVLEFDIESWSEIEQSLGKVQAFVTPRDLL